MAQRRDTSCTGASIADKTINIRTRAALGTEAEAMLAAVDVNLMWKNSNTDTNKTFELTQQWHKNQHSVGCHSSEQ